VILPSGFQLWALASEHLYVLLPLAAAGFVTAGIFAIHSLAGLSSGRVQSSEKHPTISTGADK
jgi:hypothetical protein